jgi:hypothetical protein
VDPPSASANRYQSNLATIRGDLGGVATLIKPYHGTACYRTMIRLSETVNGIRRNPHIVAAEILRSTPVGSQCAQIIGTPSKQAPAW